MWGRSIQPQGRERENKSTVVPEQVKGKWAEVLMPFPYSWLIAACKSTGIRNIKAE